MADTEDNPSLRQRFGEKMAQRILKQRKQEREEKQFKVATRRFRPRKGERGKIVLIAATKTKVANPGERVDPSYKGKVYAFYIAKTGKVSPYRERKFELGKRAKLKSRTIQPFKPQTLDPQQFPTKRARKQAFELFVERGAKLVSELVVRSRKGNVGWHETVVPLASQKMQELVDKATAGKGVGNLPMVVDVEVKLEMPDGRTRTIRVSDDFGQRKEQGAKEDDFYAPFFSKKIYALLGEQLHVLGVVTAGSANRVQKANPGLPPSQWKWRGGPWYKRDAYRAGMVARVSEVRVQPYLKRVGKRLRK